MKLKLDLDELSEAFFRDTRLIGLVAPMRDYQLCWHINQVFAIDLRKNNEIEIQLKRKRRDYYFAVFQYAEPTGALVHYIYNNQFDGEYLLPEFHHLDFIYLLKGDPVSSERLNEILGTLREIRDVQMATELPLDKLRNKSHLIF